MYIEDNVYISSFCKSTGGEEKYIKKMVKKTFQ